MYRGCHDSVPFRRHRDWGAIGRQALEGFGVQGPEVFSAGLGRGGPHEGGHQCVELFPIQRPAEQEALGEVAAGLSNCGELADQLHAFGNDFETEGSSERDEGLHHRGVLR